MLLSLFAYNFHFYRDLHKTVHVLALMMINNFLLKSLWNVVVLCVIGNVKTKEVWLVCLYWYDVTEIIQHVATNHKEQMEYQQVADYINQFKEKPVSPEVIAINSFLLCRISLHSRKEDFWSRKNYEYVLACQSTRPSYMFKNDLDVALKKGEFRFKVNNWVIS